MNAPTSAVSSVGTEFFLLQVSAGIFILGALLSLVYWFTRRESAGFIALGVTIIATLCLTAALITRYINVGHIPYVQLYETFLFVSWSVAVIAIVTDFALKSRLPSTIASVLAGLALVYIWQWPSTREGMPLVAALQSPWLDVHIATAFLSYAGFGISAGASVVYLFNRNDKVDELSYRLVAFAFPLLFLAILLGAVWANEVYGHYWSWDPKETAALVTWLVYAGYLHARLMYNWKGVKAAVFNLVGFICVMFTWLGLNILSKFIEMNSYHSYFTG
jgi:ABC-type transport system involved in cytochrome c biogenesis permease subunit